MGIITLALIYQPRHDPSNGIPLWVKLLCANYGARTRGGDDRILAVGVKRCNSPCVTLLLG